MSTCNSIDMHLYPVDMHLYRHASLSCRHATLSTCNSIYRVVKELAEELGLADLHFLALVRVPWGLGFS